MGIQNQIIIKQHCTTENCCDYQETRFDLQLQVGDEIPVRDIPIGCLKAPPDANVAKVAGYYIGIGTGEQYVFEFVSRKYLRVASDADIQKWQALRNEYQRGQSPKQG